LAHRSGFPPAQDIPLSAGFPSRHRVSFLLKGFLLAQYVLELFCVSHFLLCWPLQTSELLTY
jgi:hypothetical protein